MNTGDERCFRPQDLSDFLDGVANSGCDETTMQSDGMREFSTDAPDSVANQLVVHGLLVDASLHDDAIHVEGVDRLVAALDGKMGTVARSRIGSRGVAAVLAVATIACVMLAAVFLRPSRVSAAEALDRIIASSARSKDRLYELSVVEEFDQRKRLKNLPEEQKGERREKIVDGARLYAGGRGRFVFVCELSTGETRTSGYDGSESWSFRDSSPVHVSTETERYRGGIPGQQQTLGFTDMYSQLESLRNGYDIELSALEGTERKRLIGIRKSRDVRGPKGIEIEFDPSDGMVHRMVLNGLPRGRGGPKCVEFVLVSQDERAEGFYSHEAHHDGQRRIRYEE